MPSISEITDRSAVLLAIEECDRMGQDLFLRTYGYARAKRYRLVHDGRSYDSKAILGVAYKYQFPGAAPLANTVFSGGEATVGRVLESLGFDVVKNALPMAGVSGERSDSVSAASRTWIFQANPQDFDIDHYLNQCDGTLLFSVTMYADQIRVGDRVFIWRSKGAGTDPGRWGIIALGEVAGPVERQLDESASVGYWRKPVEGDGMANRVRLRLIRHASKRDYLKRDWLLDDSALASLLILRQPNGTNFPVTAAESMRLEALWGKTGTDWNEAECIAALRLYAKLWNQPISKTKGSPVEQLAQLIGRAPTGVYNKLMNFRSLDERNPAKGFSQISQVDRRMWERYYNAAERALDEAALEAAFRLSWLSEAPADLAGQEEAFASRVKELAAQPLDKLMADYRKSARSPVVRATVLTQSFQRSALVVAITKQRADWRCEVPDCPSPRIEAADGEPIVEVHHLQRLADGGPDTIDNTVCVCPNHHREFHLGRRAAELREVLVRLRSPED